MRIVIADDEELARFSIKSVLDQLIDDAEYLMAPNGRVLIEQVKDQAPDLVFLDIRMPGLSGLEAMEELVEEYSGIKWVILSGHADFSYAQRAIRLGASAYLLKPVDPKEVSDALDDINNLWDRERMARKAGLNGMEEKNLPAEGDPLLIRRSLGVAAQIFRLPIGVAQIAEELKVSPNYLSSEFKKYRKISLTQHLTYLRLEDARKILGKPGMTVKAAAAAVGYQGGRHFARLFKEKFGQTPSEFLETVDLDTLP